MMTSQDIAACVVRYFANGGRVTKCRQGEQTEVRYMSSFALFSAKARAKARAERLGLRTNGEEYRYSAPHSAPTEGNGPVLSVDHEMDLALREGSRWDPTEQEKEPV